MASYYFDTSALVKRYFEESGTSWVRGLTNPTLLPNIYIVRITAPEMIAAFFLKSRIGEVALADAITASERFKLDFSRQYLIMDVTSPLVDKAMTLAEQHQLRGYDSVQLAAAVELHTHGNMEESEPVTFISADNNLNSAAELEGLRVDNPNTHA